jgi:uncharacterized protein YecE (DUF72 family)
MPKRKQNPQNPQGQPPASGENGTNSPEMPDPSRQEHAVRETAGSLRVGCAVWAYDGWANSFYPQGVAKEARLQSYAHRLTAVEVNSTFYALPPISTIQKWAGDVPEYFRFSPKFPKSITHTAQLKGVKAQTASFIGVARMFGHNLGTLMLQLPPTLGPVRFSVLRDYLLELPDDLEVAVEVRHLGWFESAEGQRLNDMLREVRAGRIIFDSRPAHGSSSPDATSAQERKPDLPITPEALDPVQPFVVVRYISSPVPAENEPYLAEWAERITGWLGEGRRVLFYAHCPVEELSPSVARDLYQRVAQRVNLPHLPWDEAEKPSSPKMLTQLSLF